MEVDFDDPTTNVRGRRALAIAKPTSEGLLAMLKHDQPDQESLFPLQPGYCEYKRKALLMKVGFCDAFVWLLNTNEVREVAAMANF